MTLPHFLVDPATLAGCAVGGVVVVDGAVGRHAVTVRRLRVGEHLVLVDGAGAGVTGVVVAVGAGALEVQVDAVGTEPEARPRFVLVQALAKHGRDEQAIEAATECGVDEVVPWQAARSVVRWRGERGAKARRKWDTVLSAATIQSRRARQPVLGATATTADVVTRVRASSLALVLHEEATDPIAGLALPDDGDVLVVVGPEGGIAPEEVGELADAGARIVRLGGTVLRSSSAGPAALAVLSAASRWR
ncbi:MAG: 16S rRNA (uracil(1498)-N(3))-methyltransferase [Dermatophilaceae bacterium]